MNNSYSVEDKLAFKKKDYLYARQTAANATSAIFEGKETKSEDFIKYADDIFNWLFQDQDKPKQEPNVLPTPTVAQMKILKAIANKVGMELNDALKTKVLAWAGEIHQIRKFPENMSSVTEIVTYLEK